MDFRGFDSSVLLKSKGWNLHVHRGFPGKFESSNVSRDNASWVIGRILPRPELLRLLHVIMFSNTYSICLTIYFICSPIFTLYVSLRLSLFTDVSTICLYVSPYLSLSFSKVLYYISYSEYYIL